MLYQDVLNSGEPDAVYECFWYNFKSSVHNFAAADNKMDVIAQRVPAVSKRLNELKADKRYDDIIAEIDLFLTDFLWTAIGTLASPGGHDYHMNIANTNIKRWLSLPKNKEDPPPDIVALKIIYAVIASKLGHTTEILQMLLNIRGVADKPFILENVIASITRYCYSHHIELVLNKLTQESVTQAVVVRTLRSLGLTVPDSIRDCSKIK
jgi:hypothetical protein